MITIQQIDQNRISMRCHYAYRSRCHDVPGAEFDYNRKAWVAPVKSLSYIKEAFEGELYFKTPLWKIEGKSAPEREEIALLGPDIEVPPLALTPYKYQAEGIRFMVDRINNVGFCLNGDGVGLGKTMMTIGAIKWCAVHRGARKILIVCKKSLKSQWASEIKRIAGWNDEEGDAIWPEVPIFVTGGTTKRKKQEPYKGIHEAKAGILIANYQDFLNWKEDLDKINFDLCVIDEAHCVKGKDGKMNSLISDSIAGKPTILLTGTPIMSRPDDIWGIVHLASKSFFGGYEDFKKKYIVTEFGIYGEQIVGAVNLDELKDEMSRFLIMRTAEEVAIDLPKQRPAKNIACPMDALQEKMQGIVEERKQKQDEKKQQILDNCPLSPKGERIISAEAKAAIENINELGKMYIATLQFIADDPAVFRYMSPERGMNKQLQKLLPGNYQMSSKTEATVDAVSELVDADEKVIVFCHFSSSARMLKEAFSKIAGANPVMYTGRESDAEREANIAAFKEDPECHVIIGTEAMAEGLNLQVSRHIIHYEQADTYAQREQRIGRIRRIGSMYSHINVYDLVTAGSFDETKLQKLRNDYVLTNGVLGSKAKGKGA